MLFSRLKTSSLPTSYQLVIKGQTVERVYNPKARKVLGLKYYHDSHTGALLHLYKMLVRPLLKYVTCVWDPYLRKDINNNEKCKLLHLNLSEGVVAM